MKKQKDFYQQKAEQEGYRARSAWKLKQLDDKYNFIAPCNLILELGAAPGGWTQVLTERASHAKIIACDIVPMQPIAGATILQGDLLEPTTDDKIQQLTKGAKFDLLLSDMAPNISGNHLRDQVLMQELATAALQQAEHHLNPDAGIFLIKMFQGSEFQDYLNELRQHNYKVRIVKPAASKNNSREVYLLTKKGG